MNITLDQLLAVMPYARGRAQRFLNPLNAAMAEFEINTPKRIAAFLAQLAVESGSLRYMSELASGHDYDTRVKLGNTKAEAIEIAAKHNSTPGVWWKGHGPIQITGFNNHKFYGEKLGLDLLNHPELITEPENGCRVSACFWKENGLNELADVGSFDQITKVINGGYNGQKSRREFYITACKVFKIA